MGQTAQASVVLPSPVVIVDDVGELLLEREEGICGRCAGFALQ